MFQRLHHELVEIMLANATIMATDDHPIWSHGRGMLVSSYPESTWQDYSLHVSKMLTNEVLHGDDHGPLQVVGVKRIRKHPRSLLAGSSEWVGLIQVMTLCLHPYHWYFAQGEIC